MTNQKHEEPFGAPLFSNKRVYVCSPFRGDQYKNADQARRYCAVLAHEGIQPVAPHIFYTQFLSDDIPTSRARGLEFGLRDLQGCDEVFAFIPDSGPSEGMKGEIARAEELGIPVRKFRFRMSESDLRIALREMARGAIA